MLDLRLTGARSEELSRGCSAPRLLRDVLEVVERRSFELEVVGGLATLLPPSCSTALGHDSMRLMRELIAMRSSASISANNKDTRGRRYAHNAFTAFLEGFTCRRGVCGVL